MDGFFQKLRNSKYMNFPRFLYTLMRTKSLRKAKFFMHERRTDVEKLDDDMLLAQICYFAHHLEKALKHQKRGNRGRFKRFKLELLLNEAKKRNIREDKVFNWAWKLIKYYDTSSDLYVRFIRDEEIKVHPFKDVILDAIKKRTSVRFWQPREVPDEIIEDILYTAVHSAMSCNRQTVRFVVVKNDPDKMVVGDSNNQSMFEKAPVVIYVADDGRFFSEKYANALDVGGICSMIQLAAHAYGLGTCWVYFCESYEQKKLKKKLGLKDYMYIYSAVLMGYPLDMAEKPPRFKKDRFLIKILKKSDIL